MMISWRSQDPDDTANGEDLEGHRRKGRSNWTSGIPRRTLTSSSRTRQQNRKQNLEYVQRATGRWQSWSTRSARAALQTERIPYIRALPDSPTSIPEPPSTNESDEHDFDGGALLDRPLQKAHRNETDQHYDVCQTDYTGDSSSTTQELPSRPNWT